MVFLKNKEPIELSVPFKDLLSFQTNVEVISPVKKPIWHTGGDRLKVTKAPPLRL